MNVKGLAVTALVCFATIAVVSRVQMLRGLAGL